MKGGNPACPCGSGERYGACCRPFHRGAEPGDPVRLMRSRFSAYALGEVEYLWRTLDPEHPDSSRPEAEVLAGLRAARRALRYARLRVLDHDADRVLFHAEIYEGGKDRSFAELSRFRKHGETWRYHSGDGRPLAGDDPSVDQLRMATF